MAAGDTELLKSYDRGLNILSNRVNNGDMRDDVIWMIGTAWNRGLRLELRADSGDLALEFLTCALSLAPFAGARLRHSLMEVRELSYIQNYNRRGAHRR